jgi:hypothetical protein
MSYSPAHSGYLNVGQMDLGWIDLLQEVLEVMSWGCRQYGLALVWWGSPPIVSLTSTILRTKEMAPDYCFCVSVCLTLCPP